LRVVVSHPRRKDKDALPRGRPDGAPGRGGGDLGHPALQAECGSSRRVAVFLLSHPCAKKKAQGWGTGHLWRILNRGCWGRGIPGLKIETRSTPLRAGSGAPSPLAFSKLRKATAGPSTTPLAMRLRVASLRMTLIFSYQELQSAGLVEEARLGGGSGWGLVWRRGRLCRDCWRPGFRSLLRRGPGGSQW